MAYKDFQLEDVGTVRLYKRKGSRSLRVSVNAVGEARASMPTWMPYATGLNFVKTQKDWILSQQVRRQTQLIDGQLIGKAHHLRFLAVNSLIEPIARVRNTDILVTYPAHMAAHQVEVQRKATEACIRALRQQATQLLPQRLDSLATRHGIVYKSVAIKRLKSRWGSCDQYKNIVLNLFLMQLPWELIDYVLLHELAHTAVMRHGAPFWDEMQRLDPRAKQLRREIRAFQPTLQ